MKDKLNAIKKEWLDKAKDPKTEIRDVITILDMFGDIAPYIESVKDCEVYDTFLEDNEYYKYEVIYLEEIIDWCYDYMYDDEYDNYIECDYEVNKIVTHFVNRGIKGFAYDW